MLMLSSSHEPADVCFHLVRHGKHGEFGQVLSGRSGGSPLTGEGRMQAEGVAGWPGLGTVTRIHASPRGRTLETASIVAAARGLECRIVPELDEVNFGSWSGRRFADLEGDPLWSDWNRRRSAGRAPGGESMEDAVNRAVRHIERTARQQPGATILCVTHCDIIRGIVAHYLGLNLDHLLRFEVDPGSISTVIVGKVGARVTRLNEVPA